MKRSYSKVVSGFYRPEDVCTDCTSIEDADTICKRGTMPKHAAPESTFHEKEPKRKYVNQALRGQCEIYAGPTHLGHWYWHLWDPDDEYLEFMAVIFSHTRSRAWNISQLEWAVKRDIVDHDFFIYNAGQLFVLFGNKQLYRTAMQEVERRCGLTPGYCYRKSAICRKPAVHWGIPNEEVPEPIDTSAHSRRLSRLSRPPRRSCKPSQSLMNWLHG